MPKDEDGNLLASTTFRDQNAVLGHLWNNILEPTWKVDSPFPSSPTSRLDGCAPHGTSLGAL